MSKLFKDAEERYQALVIMAGVAMHALLSHGHRDDGVIRSGFELAELFLTEAERRTDSSP